MAGTAIENGLNGYRKVATVAAFGSLFSYAVVMCITPACVNEIGHFYHIGPSVLGRIYLAMFAGFFLSVLAGGWISDRRGKLPLIGIGCAMMGCGALLFGLTTSFSAIIAAALLLGLGGGLAEGMGAAFISDLYGGERRTAMLNLSQVVFGVGAISSPLVMARLLQVGIDWRVGYLGVAGVCATAALLTLPAALKRRERPHGEHRSGWRVVLGDPLILRLSIAQMLYVAAECGLGNWLAVFFRRDLHSSSSLAALTVAIFWIGISLGRITAAHLSRRMSDIAMICLALALSAAAHAALLFQHSPLLALLNVAAVGFFLAPVWPTILSLAGHAYPKDSGVVFGIVVAAGALGAALGPPTVGSLADAFDMRHALWTCVALLVANLVLFRRLRGDMRHEA